MTPGGSGRVFDVIIQRGAAAADDLPADIVYAGLSLGVLPAQMLAQTRPGARGALLLHACVPPSEFGAPWPDSVPVQIHGMDGDEWMREELDAAQKLVEEVENALERRHALERERGYTMWAVDLKETARSLGNALFRPLSARDPRSSLLLGLTDLRRTSSVRRTLTPYVWAPS